MTKPTLNIDIVDMLEFLGVNHIEKETKEVWFECPFPGHKPGSGNRNNSFRKSAKHEWWTFNCFVCGNHGTAADFWALHQGVRKAQARVALKQRYGSRFIDPGEGTAVLDEIERILGAKEEERSRPPVPLPNRLVEEMSVDWKGAWDAYSSDQDVPEALTYMFRRGFMWQTLAAAEIGFDPISNMISIPYRNVSGQLVGFKGRAWQQGAKPKYRMLGNKKGREDRYEFDTCDISYLMYGEWDLPAGPGGRLIVTEGELNRLALKQFGHRRTLGLSGQFLHEQQAQIIARYTDAVVLLFDEEEKAERAAALLERRINSVWIVPEHEGDPADASDEEVASWLDDAYPSTVVE